MIGNYERFDMARRPKRPWAILQPIIWAASFPKARSHRSKVDKSGMPKEVKPPYLLLCNHNSFMDFMIMSTAIFPRRANYIVAIDGFIGIEGLLRAVGGVCNRKFTRGVTLVKNMLHARNNGDIVVLFPEARYSLCGTTAVIPDSVGKLIQKMGTPVVMMLMHGHHVNSPFWNIGNRKVKPIQSELKQIISAEETKTLSLDEINERVREAFIYDDFAWQKGNGIKIKTKDRAEGLHKVLYQCPACNTEYKMTSKGAQLICTHCGKVWDMTELGELKAVAGETEFSHIPHWYEWQREGVRKEVEAGTYHFEGDVRIESLPNAKKFINLGKGRLTHGMDGFKLTGMCQGEPFEVDWTVPSLYSCHIEYDYMGRGDCVDLNTTEDTFYVFPEGEDFAVTKMALATEELYQHQTGRIG